MSLLQQRERERRELPQREGSESAPLSRRPRACRGCGAIGRGRAGDVVPLAVDARGDGPAGQGGAGRWSSWPRTGGEISSPAAGVQEDGPAGRRHAGDMVMLAADVQRMWSCWPWTRGGCGTVGRERTGGVVPLAADVREMAHWAALTCEEMALPAAGVRGDGPAGRRRAGDVVTLATNAQGDGPAVCGRARR